MNEIILFFKTKELYTTYIPLGIAILVWIALLIKFQIIRRLSLVTIPMVAIAYGIRTFSDEIVTFFQNHKVWFQVYIPVGIAIVVWLILMTKSWFFRILTVIGLPVIGFVYFVYTMTKHGPRGFSLGHLIALLFAGLMIFLMIKVIKSGSSTTRSASEPPAPAPEPRPRTPVWVWVKRVLRVILGIILLFVIVCLGTHWYDSWQKRPNKQRWVMRWEKDPYVNGVNPNERSGGPFPVYFSERTPTKIVFKVYSKSNRETATGTLTPSADENWPWTGNYEDWGNNISGQLRFRELPDGSLEGYQTTGVDSDWVFTTIKQ